MAERDVIVTDISAALDRLQRRAAGRDGTVSAEAPTTAPVAPEIVAAMESAIAHLRVGQAGVAIAGLRAIIAAHPRLAGAHFLLAAALESSGDAVGGMVELETAHRLDPSLAHVAVRLAERQTARRSPQAALATLRPFIERGDADLDILTQLGMALKALGRLDEAAEAYAAGVRLAPDSAVAEHNLAGVLGDAHRFTESAEAASHALAKGLGAPETWLVRARALQGLGDDDGAEAAFRGAIARRPAYAEAHGDLAQLIWMRTEDIAEACRDLDLALAASPTDAPLALAKSKLLRIRRRQGGRLRGPGRSAGPRRRRSQGPGQRGPDAGRGQPGGSP